MSTPGSGSLSPTPPVRGTNDSGTTIGSGSAAEHEAVSTYEVLRYIRSTFDDDEVLDSVRLEAAGNPGAWHAWRTHRVKVGKLNSPTHQIHPASRSSDESDCPPDCSSKSPPREVRQRIASAGTSAPMAARRPGEWNWDGVWEVRVKKGIDASVGEAMLFGKDAGDDLIRFLNMDHGDLEGIKENLSRSLEDAEDFRRGIV
jgi:hypothetical protein